MSDEKITVYGAHWCPDCRRSKQFLGEHQIPYNWVDIEQDPQAETFVIEKTTASVSSRQLPLPTALFWWSPAMRSWPLNWD